MNTVRWIMLLLLIISLVFALAEVVTEEVEIFSPLASISIIITLVLFFTTEPLEWLDITPREYTIISVVLIIVAIIIVGLSVILFIKVRKLKNKPSELNNMIGKKGTVLTQVSAKKSGYVMMEGSKWKANSIGEEIFEPEEIVMVSKMDGINLIVTSSRESPKREKKNERQPIFCPLCGTKIQEKASNCPNCQGKL